jgi:Leucine-rich repeat (LRR) protein
MMDEVTLNDDDPEQARSPDDTEENEHDQLPTVEQYKAEVAANDSAGQDHCCWGALYAIVAILLAVLMVVIGVVVGRDTSPSNESAGGPSPTPALPAPMPVSAPTPSPMKPVNRLFMVSEFIAEHGWSDVYTQVDTPDSPHFKAAMWIADEDPLQLEPSTDAYFRERYAAAVLYFAFKGDNWPHDVNNSWLTNEHVCTWSKGFLDNKKQTIQVGIDCRFTPTVQSIYLRGLQMEGSVPPEISLFHDLVDVDLSKNKVYTATVHGKKQGHHLPQELTKLKNLASLNLEDNKLSGIIPSWMGDFAALSVLNLKKNKLAGTIPTTFQNMHKLHTLNLEYNSLSGDLQQLKGLNQIQAMLLGNNKITGPLDEDVFVTWEKIQALDMSDNLLTGTLPEKLFALSSLQIVDLHSNDFHGSLPRLVSVNSDVHFLALHENRLSGDLESLLFMEQLEHLDLSYNEFNGTMPTQLGGLLNLRYLFLSFNDFTPGEIPTELGKLTKLADLSLQGTKRILNIPTEFGKLKQLRLLDLNRNLLSDIIPEELGNLKELNFLLLKTNNLMGPIPKSFANLTKLDSVLINDNLLSGSAASFCDPKLPVLRTAISDCGDLNCTCCQCCAEGDPECDGLVWFGGLDPVFSSAYGFERQFYVFHENSVVYPASEDAFDDEATVFDDISGDSKHPCCCQLDSAFFLPCKTSTACTLQCGGGARL